MAVVTIYHSPIAGHVPPSLVAGQVAINSADGVLFWLGSDGVTINSYSFVNPIAPTKGSTDNSTAVATTAFVQTAAAALVAGAPASLDTFNDIAAALGGDPAFSTTVNTALANRVRVDTLQSLTGGQQNQAQTNIGLDPTFPTNTNTALGNRLRVDAAQGLTTTQQTQARQNAYAAPFDALAYNGMQVNGACEIMQDGAGPFSASSSYPADNWCFYFSGAMTASVASQSADVPPGFSNAIKITVTAGEPTLAAGDYLGLFSKIEGFRFKRCGFGAAGALSVSLAFWAKAHRTGTYSGALQNGTVARSYPFVFTIISPDTWEYKTVTIPGDTAGTWNTGNGSGSVVFITMAGGTTFQAAAGAWATGNFIAVTGSINGVAATTDYLAVTGLVVLPGVELPSAGASPLIQRPYDQELLTCMRYYWRDNSPVWCHAEGVSTGAGSIRIVVPVRFLPLFRATPTISLPTLATVGIGAVDVTQFGVTTASCVVQGLSNVAAGITLSFGYSNGSFIANARL